MSSPTRSPLPWDQQRHAVTPMPQQGRLTPRYEKSLAIRLVLIAVGQACEVT
jgi:hypothetical protein